ncbi:GNAT family N-acetyltransferase [Thalassobius sp. I31.1]|uniref:GNAT family N-acetyltransferase n=1 Tax=Thalassobius sp. I31.1 TaxID=2109912 RepID=UPI000D1BD63B|nr:GNAT family N-acetyltransferase [Thalassobius sp. I31.1]
MNNPPPILPLQQSPEFARCLTAMRQLVTRHVSARSDMSWQVQSKGIGGIGLVDLVTRGPVGNMETWLQHWRDYHDTTPLLLNAPPCRPDLLRNHGLWPLITPVTLGITDLGAPQNMRSAMGQKWRNRLRRAEAYKIKVKCYDLQDHHWLIATEDTQARQKGYRGYPAGFSTLFGQINPGQAKVFEAQYQGEIIAGIVVLLHGRMATWQIGHNLPEGRQLNAMNLLLWRAMCWLSERGYMQLDLGVLNGKDAEGLTRFKLGSGAKAQRQGGTWLYMNTLAPLAKRLPSRLSGFRNFRGREPETFKVSEPFSSKENGAARGAVQDLIRSQ